MARLSGAVVIVSGAGRDIGSSHAGGLLSRSSFANTSMEADARTEQWLRPLQAGEASDSTDNQKAASATTPAIMSGTEC
ncbi:hypothetical protein SAMN05216304_11279 [Bosea sp. OK403]|nr:hypothetical protein SAMN05216304_11279 [Bosea sp. OK403]